MISHQSLLLSTTILNDTYFKGDVIRRIKINFEFKREKDYIKSV